VPRPDDYGSYKSSSDTPSLRAEKYPDDAPRYVSETEPYSAADSPEAYVRVILSDGVDDGGPGRIVEGRYSILNGLLQLTDLAGKHPCKPSAVGTGGRGRDCTSPTEKARGGRRLLSPA
jgi:hypothetical protein